MSEKVTSDGRQVASMGKPGAEGQMAPAQAGQLTPNRRQVALPPIRVNQTIVTKSNHFCLDLL